jgi:hypothetical protein
MVEFILRDYRWLCRCSDITVRRDRLQYQTEFSSRKKFSVSEVETEPKNRPDRVCSINSRPRPHIIATMASKFMANTAFEARLLLRPSHQRTVWTVNKLKCPIPGRPTLPPILSSRSYSDSTSTPTPPFPESSGSTEGSQSSGPGDKNWSHSKTWGKVWGWARARATTLGLGAAALVRTGSLYMLIETC